jgi:hypothetical protein
MEFCDNANKPSNFTKPYQLLSLQQSAYIVDFIMLTMAFEMTAESNGGEC